MNYSKMIRLSSMVFTVLTLLLLRTAVASAASSQSSAVGNIVGSATSAHAENNNPLNGAVVIPTGINQMLGAQSQTSTWTGVARPNTALPNEALIGVAAISTSDVWAVGYSLVSSASPLQTLTEHWDGTAWRVVTSPNTGMFSNFLEGVMAISSNDVWSVGGYYTSNSSNPTEQTLIEHWKGTAWSVVSSPNFGGGNIVNQLWTVATISTNDVWTVGDNQTSSTSFQAFTEHWKGKSWSIIPPG